MEDRTPHPSLRINGGMQSPGSLGSATQFKNSEHETQNNTLNNVQGAVSFEGTTTHEHHASELSLDPGRGYTYPPHLQNNVTNVGSSTPMDVPFTMGTQANAKQFQLFPTDGGKHI